MSPHRTQISGGFAEDNLPRVVIPCTVSYGQNNRLTRFFTDQLAVLAHHSPNYFVRLFFENIAQTVFMCSNTLPRLLFKIIVIGTEAESA